MVSGALTGVGRIKQEYKREKKNEFHVTPSRSVEISGDLPPRGTTIPPSVTVVTSKKFNTPRVSYSTGENNTEVLHNGHGAVAGC